MLAASGRASPFGDLANGATAAGADAGTSVQRANLFAGGLRRSGQSDRAYSDGLKIGRGKSWPPTLAASSAPANCTAMNIGTSAGAIPEKLLVMLRAIVIAGLAKLVDEVNQ